MEGYTEKMVRKVILLLSGVQWPEYFAVTPLCAFCLPFRRKKKAQSVAQYEQTWFGFA